MLILLITAFSTAPEPVEVFDDSLLAIRVNKDESTLLSGFSHNHVIRADRFNANASLDRDTGKCELQVTVPVASLRVDEPDMRERFGLETGLDEDDRAEIRRHMLDEDQLFSERFPTIRLESTQCSLQGTTLDLRGRLTIRGETRKLRTELERVVDERGRTAFVGSFSIKATEFGFEPYSAGLGSLQNANEMTVHLELYVELPE